MRRRPPTPLRSRTAIARPLASLAAAMLAVMASTAMSAAPASAAAGDYGFAPYVDMSNSQESLLDTAITGHGVKAFTAAFVIGTGCYQIWGDTLPVGNDPFTDPLISKAKSEGASVIISSGGAAGWPLAWTCTAQSDITAGYQKIISSYGVNWLDFDIEGAAIADQAAATRNMKAMASLKASNPGLQFSVTLPVLPDGLDDRRGQHHQGGQGRRRQGRPRQHHGDGLLPGIQDMGQAAIDATEATLGQMKSVDSRYTYGNVGITPMIGVNDDGSVFTLENAATVAGWAASNGVGRLSMWSVNRDTACSGIASRAPAASSTCSGVPQKTLAFVDALSRS